MWIILELIGTILVSLYLFLEYKKNKRIEQLYLSLFLFIGIIRRSFSDNNILNTSLGFIQIILLCISLYLYFEHITSK